MDSGRDHPTERVLATHRLLLTIGGSSKIVIVKEIVHTIDVSRNGARLKGRRTLKPNWRGSLHLLSSGRQAAFRVLWQSKPSPEHEFLETGIELERASGNFWGIPFSDPMPEPPPAEIAIEDAAVAPGELLEELQELSQLQSQNGERILEAVWCGLVEHLEERKVLTRTELVASLRKIAQQSLPAAKAKGAGA